MTDAFLVSEVGTAPSPASGIADDEFHDTAVWLVEPKRTTSVVKYSGTLIHPTRRDKVGIIVTAFAHYIYEASNKELVLADIQGIVLYDINCPVYDLSSQGSPMSVQGGDAVFLFDLMTHSVAQYASLLLLGIVESLTDCLAGTPVLVIMEVRG